MGAVTKNYSDLKFWIETILKNGNVLKNCSKFQFDEEACLGGFVSDLNFVQVTAENGDVHHLVVKFAKINDRDHVFPKLEMFQSEALIYNEIHPEFQKLNLPNCNFMPKFYGSHTFNETMVLIFENLNKSGFEMWPRTKPLSLDHTKLIFKEFSKWHALSFALKELHPEIFEKFGQKLGNNTWGMFAQKSQLHKAAQINLLYVTELLRGEGVVDQEFLDKMGPLGEEILQIFTQLYKEDLEYAVINHGDCWNNNYMYKYEANLNEKTGERSPTAAKIIDWQTSFIAPPVFDLSFFFYSTSDKTQYDNYHELLELYYTNFTTNLKSLGCDPKKLYPLEVYQKQWKKFSVFGFVLAPLFARTIWLADDEDLPNFDVDGASIKKNGEVFLVKIKKPQQFKRYMIDLFRHYSSLNYL